MAATTKFIFFCLILFGQFAFAASQCYQASISDSNFEGFSASDTKLTILYGGPGHPSAIAVSAASLGKKGRVNGEFDPCVKSAKDATELHCNLVPHIGELNFSADAKGVLTQVQPRGKLSANHKVDDSVNGVLGTTFGDWGSKIDLKPASKEECMKTIYGPLSDAKASQAPGASGMSAAPSIAAPPVGHATVVN